MQYTEEQLAAHYRYLSPESKRKITKIVANFCYIEKIEKRSDRAAEEIKEMEREEERQKAERKELECSFCGRSQKYLDRLIAGNGAYICDECAKMCYSIITENIKPEDLESEEDKP